MSADRDNFICEYERLNIPVSASQLSKFDEFAELLLRWNRKFNLIGKSTENSIYTRHLLDSIQLFPYINELDTVLDIGAGSGIPSIPLAILMDAKIYACERIGKKCEFMRAARRTLEIQSRFEVLQEDINNIRSKNISFDIITSRAFSEIEEIIRLSLPLLKPNGRLVLLKNEADECKFLDLSKKYSVTFTNHKSITSPKGKIIIAHR